MAQVNLNKLLRRWCFTWFNYTSEDIERIKTFSDPNEHCRYVIIGFERCPETDKPHIQGYIEFASGVSGIQAMKRLLGRDLKKGGCPIRIFPCNGTRDQNIAYCKKLESKDSTFAMPYIEVSIAPGKQGQRTDVFRDIHALATEGAHIVQIADEHPEETIRYFSGIDKLTKAIDEHASLESAKKRFSNWVPYDWQKVLIDEVAVPCNNDRKIIWYYDTIGGKGKSMLCDYLHFMHDAELLENGRTADISLAWQMKPIVLFDLSRSTQEHVNYGAIESIKNGRMFSGKYQSGTKWANNKAHVVIFANWPPDKYKLSLDRWDIRDITDAVCIHKENNSLPLTETEAEDNVPCFAPANGCSRVTVESKIHTPATNDDKILMEGKRLLELRKREDEHMEYLKKREKKEFDEIYNKIREERLNKERNLYKSQSDSIEDSDEI